MRMRLKFSLCAGAIVASSWAGPAWSQDALNLGSNRGSVQAEEEAASRELARKNELISSILAARQSASHRQFGPELNALLSGKLLSASVASLEAFLAAGGLGDVEAAVRDGAVTNTLGDTAADLAFTPVAPCRVVDTRSAAAGALVAGVARDFKVRNAGGFAVQGGSATDCLIPATATAVEMNFVAVGAAGPGDIRAYAFAGTLPNASVLNYSNVPGAPLLNIANAIAQPVCNPATTTCTNDLTVLAEASNTHLIIDVVGYFNKVNTAAIKSFAANATTTGVQIPVTATCANSGGAQVTIVAPVAGKIVATEDSAYVLAHVTGTPSIVISAIGTTATDCLLSPGVGFNAIRLDGPAGTGTYVLPVSSSRVVSVAAGSSTTLFLNTQITSGTGHSIYSGRIQAIFIPN